MVKIKYYGISGSRRYTSDKLVEDVQSRVFEIMQKGCGIVSGGALGVDYFALDVAIKIAPSRIKIFLPTSFQIYSNHYLKRAEEGVINCAQAYCLINQLSQFQKLNPYGLIEDFEEDIVDTRTYYKRNQRVVDNCDILVAFHVNKTQGTQDAINKAISLGKHTEIFEYII